jgi:microcin C transport system permease protein
VATGDLGTSYRYNMPVWDVMASRFPVSLYYGIITLILTYAICIPLGILKAIKHRTAVDNISSILIFIGYAVPGYALGSLLLLYFSVRLEWFPMGGFVSLQFDDLSLWGKVKDLASHSALPLICYMMGSFALVTLLLKNHLMDNLASDYVRTAIAKGVSFRKSVTGHALRNSLLSLLTAVGGQVGGIVGGALIVESFFAMPGMGNLLVTAINGMPLTSLADVPKAMAKATDGLHRIEFKGDPSLIFLDAKAAEASGPALQRAYGLPALSRLE